MRCGRFPEVIWCAEGVLWASFEELPKEYRGLPLRDLTGKLIVPGLTDLHPRAAVRIPGKRRWIWELIEWLDRQTFPAEVKYGDTGVCGTGVRCFRRSDEEKRYDESLYFRYPSAVSPRKFSWIIWKRLGSFLS